MTEPAKLTAIWQELMRRAQAKAAHARNSAEGVYGSGFSAGDAHACLHAAMLIERVIGSPLCDPLTTARDHITKTL